MVADEAPAGMLARCPWLLFLKLWCLLSLGFYPGLYIESRFRTLANPFSLGPDLTLTVNKVVIWASSAFPRRKIPSLPQQVGIPASRKVCDLLQPDDDLGVRS